MKCGTCQGRGFIELEHGLIMVECDECGGKGEVEDTMLKMKTLLFEAGNDIALENEKDKLFDTILTPKIVGVEAPQVGVIDDSSSGIESDNQQGVIDGSITKLGEEGILRGVGPPSKSAGGTDTGKSKRTRKPKAKKKARARAG